jgi:hypothetical protein
LGSLAGDRAISRHSPYSQPDKPSIESSKLIANSHAAQQGLDYT